MRQPKILDVVNAVRLVAPRYNEVRAWWYAPPHRLHLDGVAPGTPAQRNTRSLEVVIESDADAQPDFDAIARELSRHLSAFPVAVRAFVGSREERHLFRLLSGARAV